MNASEMNKNKLKKDRNDEEARPSRCRWWMTWTAKINWSQKLALKPKSNCRRRKTPFAIKIKLIDVDADDGDDGDEHLCDLNARIPFGERVYVQLQPLCRQFIRIDVI